MSLHDARRDLADRCAIRGVLDRLGDRWSMLVLQRLSRSPARFAQLQRDLDDISKRMLAKTLRTLEQDGLVRRRVFETRPPAVEYALTGLGTSFMPHLDALAAWADAHFDVIRAARAAYVAPSPQPAL